MEEGWGRGGDRWKKGASRGRESKETEMTK